MTTKNASPIGDVTFKERYDAAFDLARAETVSAGRLAQLRLAPDGRPRPAAPFGRGPAAARVLSGVIRVASLVGGALPAGAAHALARVGGTVEWGVRPAKRRILAENLGHAVGLPPDDLRVRALVRHEVVNEARRSVDLLWALRRPHELRASTSVTGVEHIQEALAVRHGVILSSLHLGGWEVATAIPAAVVPVPQPRSSKTTGWPGRSIRSGPRRAWRACTRRRLRGSAAAVLRRGEALLVLGETEERATRRLPSALPRRRGRVAGGRRGAVAALRCADRAVLRAAGRAEGWRVEIERPLAPAAQARRARRESGGNCRSSRIAGAPSCAAFRSTGRRCIRSVGCDSDDDQS